MSGSGRLGGWGWGWLARHCAPKWLSGWLGLASWGRLAGWPVDLLGFAGASWLAGLIGVVWLGAARWFDTCFEKPQEDDGSNGSPYINYVFIINTHTHIYIYVYIYIYIYIYKIPCKSVQKSCIK